MTIRASAEATGWAEAHGVRFQPSLTGTLNLSRTNAFFLGGGKALVNAYYRTAERLGVDILYDTEVQSLVLEDRRVREAVLSSKGFPETVQATLGRRVLRRLPGQYRLAARSTGARRPRTS